MHHPIHALFEAAHQEVAAAQQLLHQEAQRFNQTFLLTADEVEQQLHATVEMHVSGAAIELCVSSRELAFSLRPTGRRMGKYCWELVAFQGRDGYPEHVCTLYYDGTESQSARRLRGARLVAAIGEYLDARQAQPKLSAAETRGRVLEFQRDETTVLQCDHARDLQHA